MGLLDDAIRDHLELKRRSGADPGDVTRLEQEAFGDHAAGETTYRGLKVDALDSAARAVPQEAAADEAHGPEDSGDASARIGDASVHEPSEGGGHASETASPAAPGEHDEQATRQFTALEREDAQSREPSEPPREPAGAEQAGEAKPDEVDGEQHDVLEETPDFLQETPEHDRLWFEQKPPRDFDF